MPRIQPATWTALFGICLLSGCASPERQLSAGLQDAGLSPRMAACMAHEMTPRLSITQLLRLRDLGRATRRDPMRTSIAQYLHDIRALGDPKILTVASAAAINCALP